MPRSRSIAHLGYAKVLTQSLNIMLTEKERRGVDLYSRVHPDIVFLDIAPDIGMFDFGRADELIAEGGYTNVSPEAVALQAKRDCGLIGPGGEDYTRSLSFAALQRGQASGRFLPPFRSVMKP